jgi:hypothetical protein
MLSDFQIKDMKENQKAFNRFMRSCGDNVKKANRLNSIWVTSIPCPTDIGLEDPKDKWAIFRDKALEEGYTIEQLELFLLFVN